MNALDVLCAQLTRDLFAIAKFLLTISRSRYYSMSNNSKMVQDSAILLHCRYSLGRPVMIGTPMVIFALLTVFGALLVQSWYTCDDWYTSGHFCAVLTIGTLLVLSWETCDDWYTNGHFCCFGCF